MPREQNVGNIKKLKMENKKQQVDAPKEGMEPDKILNKHIKNVALLNELTDWHKGFIINAMKEYGQSTAPYKPEGLEEIAKKYADKQGFKIYTDDETGETDSSYYWVINAFKAGYSATPQGDAVEFHEWVIKNEYEINNRAQTTHTTSQLYYIFINSKNK